MTAQPPAAPERHASSHHCPFLGIPGDDTTYYQYPSQTNYCFVPNHPEPIQFAHQEAVCLTANFSRCPVYRVEGATSLPPEIRGTGTHPQRPRIRLGLILAGILTLGALIALGVFFLLPRLGKDTLALSSLPSPTATPSVEQVLAVVVLSLTPSPALSTELISATFPASATPAATVTPPPPASTPFPTHTVTQTLIPTHTFTPAPTFTPTYFPSPIPGFGTPYATDPPLVIHVVSEGQSFTSIADLYETTPEVLAAINQLIPGQSLWIGLQIVVPLGVTDATGLPHFTVYLNTEDTTLFALAAQFNTTPELIQRYNALGPIPEIPAARYYIIPLP